MTPKRFRCSAEASRTWGRLLCVYAFLRAKGDPQPEGHKYDEHLSPSKGCHSDLGTRPRTMYWDAERALALLETFGVSQRASVALARRSLARQRRTDTRRKYGLSQCDSDEDHCQGCDVHNLLQGAKEWLGWSLGEDAFELPELPW